MGWQKVRLGAVVRQFDEYVTELEPRNYKKLSVKLYGRGVVLDKPADGASLLMKRHQFARSGQIIVSEIWAKKGAIGLVPQDGDGALCTSHFFLFDIDSEQLDSRWFHYLCVGNYFEAQVGGSARGTTSYASIRPKRFLNCVIPLPPLDEQRAIAQRLDEVQAKLEEREVELAAVEREADAMLFNVFQDITDGVEYLPLSKVAPLVRRPVEVGLDGEYPELGVRSFGKGTFHKPTLMGGDVGNKRLFEIHQGDLLFNIVFAWEGAIAIPGAEDRGRVGSHRFLTCVPKPELALAEFLRFYLLSPEGLQKLGEASPGGAGRNRTLGIKKAASIHVPVPDMGVQRRFVELCAQVEEMRAIRASTAKDIETLVPAMLHEIFGQQSSKPEAASVVSGTNAFQLPARQNAEIDKPFREALLVGAIVKAFHEDNGQPIGNFRLQKAVYFARRQMGESELDKEYLRKAAGPYNPTMRYSGGIKIATDKNWIKRATGKYGEGNALGDTAAEMDEWIERYQFSSAAAWVRDRFKYKSNDLWEALATIDYAILALDDDGTRPTPAEILSYIKNDDEWRPKIAKLRLTEASIQNAMVELEALFVNTSE
ncbi:hypothetical protein CPT32_30180 [Rhizobium sophoriradicis]|uniref:restriction endonuclease subunit S n=1 Tax=Rhizobium sophoriradicis TaxID=1535245 RepID=UPI000BBE0483|nr:restriction endonuclease subunit S [Rhizobium sophoriradicis]PCK83271.1 hypothetical protein CPT32_30180 [Rhizobium sophoriradicis]